MKKRVSKDRPGFLRVPRIKSVSFRSSVEIGRFQHAHVEATAEVPAGQQPEEVLEGLKSFVARELNRVKNGDRRPVGRFAELLKSGGVIEVPLD